MSFQLIRAHIESKVNNAFQALVPPVEVIFDNVQDTPPAVPYVECLISYSNTTEPVLCPDGGAVENLRGDLQLSIYGPRGRGMAALEFYAAEGMKAINTMFDRAADAQVKCGQILGPVPVLTGTEPYALVTLSCPFTASVRTAIPPAGDGGGGSSRLKTNEVALTNPLP